MDVIGAGAKFLELAAKAGEGLSDIVVSAELEERLERLPTKLGAYGVDPFGFDPQYIRRYLGPLVWAYRYYFRCQTFGIENVPDGRCVLLANHSGQLPYDGAMIAAALFLERDPPLAARAMVERFVPSTPFVSPFLARFGQVLGTPENCRRLLQAEEVIQIFPEGVAGLNKTWKDRYKLQRFGQGFMRLAIEMNAPMVPTVVIGAEEQAPSFANLKRVGKLFGLPAFPLTLAPLAGIVPLPTRYRIYFGEPMRFTGDANDEDEVITGKVEQVKARMQEMVEQGLAAREHVFW
ncbi:MAG TPA: lysophospholipid acyltransferase family protein [Myxococcota bacterium]|nr:lysophospholipid acyltransferase family protein [Myxococcota bacterium]